jgi:hypothetical protein
VIKFCPAIPIENGQRIGGCRPAKLTKPYYAGKAAVSLLLQLGIRVRCIARPQGSQKCRNSLSEPHFSLQRDDIGAARRPGSQARDNPLAAAAQPLKPEKNPPGDIRDSQVFVGYSSALGFSLKVPQGWARQDLPDGAAFADKYGRITVSETTRTSAPDLGTLVPEVEKSARAVSVTKPNP